MKMRAVHRGTRAGSGTYSAAYREGINVVDERTGELYKYAWRQTVIGDIKGRGIELKSQFDGDTRLDWARNTQKLWNAAERNELRKHALVAREYMVVLPREMSDEQRFTLVQGFSRALADRYENAVHFAIHAPREGRAYTHHAHLLTTIRKVTPDGFGEKTNAELTDRQRQLRGLSTPASIEQPQVRALWKQHMTAAMKEAGLARSVDRVDFKADFKTRGAKAELGGHTYATYRKELRDKNFDINGQRRADYARTRPTAFEKEEIAHRKEAILLREERDLQLRKERVKERNRERARERMLARKALGIKPERKAKHRPERTFEPVERNRQHPQQPFENAERNREHPHHRPSAPAYARQKAAAPPKPRFSEQEIQLQALRKWVERRNRENLAGINKNRSLEGVKKWVTRRDKEDQAVEPMTVERVPVSQDTTSSKRIPEQEIRVKSLQKWVEHRDREDQAEHIRGLSMEGLRNWVARRGKEDRGENLDVERAWTYGGRNQSREREPQRGMAYIQNGYGYDSGWGFAL